MQDGEYTILGIHDGHNCGATLTRGGTIVASVSEERLTRRKNASGYPAKSIEEVLRIGGVAPHALSEVAYASLFMHTASHLEDISQWYPVGIEEQIADARRPPEYGRSIFEARKRERIAQAARHLGIAESRVAFVEHHLAHLAAAYFTAPRPDPGGPVLGLTLDGAGDGLCATVSICRGNAIERIAQTDRNASLGKIYSRVTYLMGMTPWEHEYKLMGLAPYADPARADQAAEPLRRLLGLSEDGLGFALKTELSTNYCYRHLRAVFERVRFDTLAGATQRFTEEMLVAWVRSCIRATGIADLVCGGGVFMNVKANMLVAELPEVRSIYVMPSASDESLSIGACLSRYYERHRDADARASRLAHLYLGGRDEAGAESAAVEAARARLQLTVSRPPDMNAEIADLLAAGEIVAVCRGPMEWGARALGNRSILSTADNVRRIDEINQMIKMRDFWMPFAPSIKSEAAARYFEPAKGIDYGFMTFAAPVRPAAYDEIIAGSHPKDRTIRPQVVTAAANPDYHALIGHFERLTGRGAILNTSFNLHGEPIVATGQDAIRVMANSGIQHLALNRHLLSKRQ
ncbi:MAG TPA: carbamoyltransferase C-terminal domain-containing protein [Xanthobacteraceae bacterium]|nr:carbamoyltransferase C-terminal domain-containing protein [Xanthobacteraceae bacterium]